MKCDDRVLQSAISPTFQNSTPLIIPTPFYFLFALRSRYDDLITLFSFKDQEIELHRSIG